MTDVVPEHRLDFYNRFGVEIAASVAEALDELIEAQTGRRGGTELCTEIAEIVRRMWLASAPDYRNPPLDDAVAMIGRAIERLTNVRPVSADLREEIRLELLRAHSELLSALVNFYRDPLTSANRNPRRRSALPTGKSGGRWNRWSEANGACLAS